MLVDLGTITADEVDSITGGIIKEEIKITINKVIFEYDYLMVLGPVFPHEV